jgi:hypothetical protein
MAKYWHHRRFPLKQAAKSKRPTTGFILLDRFSVADIHRWKQFQDDIQRFHWDYYGALAFQRSQISGELKKALLSGAPGPFEFKQWQRSMKYKYALKPLSGAGSMIDPGGRFNVGDYNPAQFTPFPALYLAQDKDTALQEFLSQKIDAGQLDKALDFALSNPTSITTVSLSGRLEAVLDLSRPEQLQPLMDLLKNFSVPDHLKKAAKQMGLLEPELIRTVPKLVEVLQVPNWREWPTHFDVPAASQIFGQLAVDAGIEGIIYKSKFSGKDCLAIFPQNFDEASGSFVELDDEPPSGAVCKRLDVKTWNEIKNG